MGLYDTVNVPCPTCGTKVGFQSKGGDCLLEEYELNEAPANVLSDIMRNGPWTCASCGSVYGVTFDYEPAKVTSVNSVLWPPKTKDTPTDNQSVRVVRKAVLMEDEGKEHVIDVDFPNRKAAEEWIADQEYFRPDDFYII